MEAIKQSKHALLSAGDMTYVLIGVLPSYAALLAVLSYFEYEENNKRELWDSGFRPESYFYCKLYVWYMQYTVQDT